MYVTLATVLTSNASTLHKTHGPDQTPACLPDSPHLSQRQTLGMAQINPTCEVDTSCDDMIQNQAQY